MSKRKGNKPVRRDKKGRLVSGSGSLNPRGMPPSVREVRNMLALEAPLMLEVFRRALKKSGNQGFLALKGLEQVIGKAPQPVQVTGANGGPVCVDLRGLSNEQLARIEALRREADAIRGRSADAGGDSGGAGAP